MKKFNFVVVGLILLCLCTFLARVSAAAGHEEFERQNKKDEAAYNANPSKEFSCQSTERTKSYAVLDCNDMDNSITANSVITVKKYEPFECDRDEKTYSYFDCNVLGKEESILKVDCGKKNRRLKEGRKVTIKLKTSNQKTQQSN